MKVKYTFEDWNRERTIEKTAVFDVEDETNEEEILEKFFNVIWLKRLSQLA